VSGSPVWIHFELLRPKTGSARTTPIAFRPMASAQNRRTHPDWAPSKDESRTRENQQPQTDNPTDRDRDGKRCGVTQDLATCPDTIQRIYFGSTALYWATSSVERIVLGSRMRIDKDSPGNRKVTKPTFKAMSRDEDGCSCRRKHRRGTAGGVS
jgi:hypothetical protein